jgi:hypothetical protein
LLYVLGGFTAYLLRGTLGLPIRPERLVGRDGVVMTRYFDEVFFDTAGPATRA